MFYCDSGIIRARKMGMFRVNIDMLKAHLRSFGILMDYPGTVFHSGDHLVLLIYKNAHLSEHSAQFAILLTYAIRWTYVAEKPSQFR
jgi:hypothetical protein